VTILSNEDLEILKFPAGIMLSLSFN